MMAILSFWRLFEEFPKWVLKPLPSDDADDEITTLLNNNMHK